MSLVEMTFEDWVEQFRPVKNSQRPEDDYGLGGIVWETYGDDIKAIRSIMQNGTAEQTWKVWTLVEGDEGRVITNGYHYVNRLGYLVTEEPANPKLFYEVET